MSAVQWLTNTLDQSGMPYRETHHHIAITAQDIAQREHVSGHKVAKTVAVNIDGETVLLVLPASRMVSMGRVREIARTPHARLLTEGEMLSKFQDCEVGAIPPLRHWPETEIWVDRELCKQDEVIFPGGTHESSVQVKLSDWRALARPREESFSVPLDAWSGVGEEERWRDTEVSIMEMESGQGD